MKTVLSSSYLFTTIISLTYIYSLFPFLSPLILHLGLFRLFSFCVFFTCLLLFLLLPNRPSSSIRSLPFLPSLFLSFLSNSIPTYPFTFPHPSIPFHAISLPLLSFPFFFPFISNSDHHYHFPHTSYRYYRIPHILALIFITLNILLSSLI